VKDNVYLLPLGNLETKFMERLGGCLSERFVYGFKVLPPIDITSSNHDGDKQQPFSPLIFEQMKRYFYSDTRYLLGLTDLDLCCLGSDTPFGEVNRGHSAGLVSVYRLRPEYYGSFENHELLFQRTLKESTHQLAHLEGLEHCLSNYCVMYQARNVMDLDEQESMICLDCEKNYHKSKNNS